MVTPLPVTVVRSARLSSHFGFPVVLASEAFQHTGSFKFRAAYHVASRVPQRTLLTVSSGNFGQALAYACSLLGKSCCVVMPETSAKVKIEAVRRLGARVELVNVTKKSRADRLGELAQ